MLHRVSRYLFFSPSVPNFFKNAHARTFKNAAHMSEIEEQLSKSYANVEHVSLPPGTPVFCFWKGKHIKKAVPVTPSSNPGDLANFIKEHHNDPKFLAMSAIDTKTPSYCLKVSKITYYVDFDDLDLYKEPDQKILEDVDNFNTKNKLTKSS
jgi:hypothetical protein